MPGHVKAKQVVDQPLESPCFLTGRTPVEVNEQGRIRVVVAEGCIEGMIDATDADALKIKVSRFEG